jgi:glucokinase
MSQTPELAPELAVAMEWGGTWIRASVIDRQGEIRWQSRVANPKGGTQARLLEAATGLLREAIARCAGRGLAGIGVAVAGPVDAETGKLYDPPNLRVLDGVSLKARWEPLLGYRVWVGNDANLAALGEYHYGAGRDARAAGRPPRTLAYLTVSTGIGGGVVDRGEMFVGAYGLAPEIGHMIIDRSGTAPRCQCGGSGCLEALASGTAIARIAQARLAGKERPPSWLAAAEVESISSQMVFEAAAQGAATATGCRVEVTFDPIIHDPLKLQIDHVLALKEAHEAGAGRWARSRRREFANWLPNLLATSSASNTAKGARGASQWAPSDPAFRCHYARIRAGTWLAWAGLTVPPGERRALKQMLDRCAQDAR